MILWRVFRAEWLKLKGTFAPKMALLAPATIVILKLVICSQAPFSTLGRMGVANHWIALARINLLFWGLLMLPLYITLQTALVAGIDHAENQWKSILTRPIPRWTIYVAKLAVILALLLLSTLELVTGVIASGALMPQLQSELAFSSAIPATFILKESMSMSCLAFLALCIQHWLSLRWRSFAVSISSGIVAMVTGYAMYIASQPNGSWAQYFPWTLPMLVIARWPVELGKVLAIGIALGCIISAFGCAEFAHRDVQ